MKVAILSAGFESSLVRLQPHRTLTEMGHQLAALGHEVVLISDGASRLPVRDTLYGVPVLRLTNLSWFHGRPNPGLLSLVEQESPDLLLWHLGIGSFYHQNLRFPFSQPVIAVITSPIHRPMEILRLGPAKLSSNVDLLAQHMAAALVPAIAIRRSFAEGGLTGAITLSERTRRFLVQRGAPPERIWVVPPGVDTSWLEASMDKGARLRLRYQLGFEERDFVFIYFGSPAPVRGVFTMLEAARRVARHQPQLRLLILSRRSSHQWQRETVRLNNLTCQDGLKGRVQVVDGFLSQSGLIRLISAGDAVCLPFEILPSDVPLSILEAMALAKGVITTEIASIPELVGEDRGSLVRPGSVGALAQQFLLTIDSRDIVEAMGQCARSYVQASRTWAHMGSNLNATLQVVAYAAR